MKYQEYKPSNKLENLIDSYWLIKDLNQFETQRILPDGCADIIFNLGEANSSIPKETVAISGMMTKFSDVSLGNGSELLGIRFKSGQLSNLTNHPLFELKNKRPPVNVMEWTREKDKGFPALKLGPNDRCPCGSGKKLKKCCGRI